YYPGSPNTLPDSTKEDNMNLSNQQRVIIEGLDSATVVGIAFAAFAIGILLTGALWFIHSHT
ncbi:transforming growth factor beta receptor type 3 isoform X3, partial [Biomphalaria glabrata]